jgi:hypothetical protein
MNQNIMTKVDKIKTSGYLELYVAGLLSKHFESRITRLSRRYREIREEIVEIRNSVLKIAVLYYFPKSKIKLKILKRLYQLN